MTEQANETTDENPAPDARKAATVIRDLMEFCVMDDLIRDWKGEDGDEMDGSLSWAICLREQARDAIRDLEGEGAFNAEEVE